MHFFVVFFFENLGGVVARFRIGIALRGEGIALLVVQVLLQVEERVEKDGRHLAAFHVRQTDLARHRRPDHVQHLIGKRKQKKNKTVSIIRLLLARVHRVSILFDDISMDRFMLWFFMNLLLVRMISKAALMIVVAIHSRYCIDRTLVYVKKKGAVRAWTPLLRMGFDSIWTSACPSQTIRAIDHCPDLVLENGMNETTPKQ